jgi:hypothetical protein
MSGMYRKMTKKERSARCRIACLWAELVGRLFFEGSAVSWRMASNNFGPEMASERLSLESTAINASSVTVVEGEVGEGRAICGVSYRFQSVTVYIYPGKGLHFPPGIHAV